jgi:hypothetical protein
MNTITMGYERPVQFLEQVDLTSETAPDDSGGDAAQLLKL